LEAAALSLLDRSCSRPGLFLDLGATLSTLATMGILAAVLAAPIPPAEDLPELLISRQLAAAEGLRVGEVVTLTARAPGARSARERRTDGGGRAAGADVAERRFRIAGIYEPAPDPSRLGAARLEARLHLPELLALTADPGDPLGAESVTLVNVALADATAAPAFGRAVAARMPGLLAHATAGPREGVDSFVVLERFHLAIAIVTLVGSTIFLLALMVMLVDERRDTVAILRLIGLRRRRILLQVLFEGLLIAAAGAAFGVLLSIATQGAFNRFFQWRYDTTLVFVRITPRIVQRTVLLAVPFGLGASLLSSWSLVRREILALARR
jgi:putative ABC transport system permease protein